MVKRGLLLLLAAMMFWKTLPVEAANDRDRVEQLLQGMSTEEKVGQLMIGYFYGPVVSAELQQQLEELHLGGVILFSSCGNIQDVQQVAALTGNIQQAARRSGQLPLFIAIDQEGGRVVRLTQGVTVFPGNMALGAAGSEEYTRQAAEFTGRELRALGINLNFAPVVDVNNNPLNPIIGVRSFGSSPAEVARLGSAAVAGYTAAGVVCTAKHFPGHGDTDIDSHVGLPINRHSRQHIEATELVPFKAMVKAGVPAVMTAHIVAPALGEAEKPATLSPTVLAMLRREIGFKGLIITDSLTMGAIAEQYSLQDAAVRAFLAGADVLLVGAAAGHRPEEMEQAYQGLLTAVNTGRISQERLDASVRRILKVKARYNILDQPYTNNDFSLLRTADSLKLAETVAEKSVTLVKNDAGLLPVTAKEVIPVVWPKEFQQAAKPLLVQCPFLKPIYVPLQATETDWLKVREEIEGARTVVVGTYDLTRHKQWVQWIKSLEPEKVVAVALRTPYDLMEIPEVGAYVAVYSDNPVAVSALGQLLKGEITPQGHLPVDLPGLFQRGWGMAAFSSNRH